MLETFFGRPIIYGEKIGFIGLGKLGMPCAEAIRKKGFHVAGYDIEEKRSDLVEIRDSIEDLCRDRDIVFVATPTPHEEGYDGREPTSHKEVRDFNYDSLKKVLTRCSLKPFIKSLDSPFPVDPLKSGCASTGSCVCVYGR